MNRATATVAPVGVGEERRGNLWRPRGARIDEGIEVESIVAERVLLHLATVYKLDGVYLPIKSKVIGKALMNPLPDKRQFGVLSE